MLNRPTVQRSRGHSCQPAVLLPTRAASVCPVHALAAAQRDVSRRQLKQLLIFLLVPLGQESLARAILQGGKRCIGTGLVNLTTHLQCAALTHPGGAWAAL